ncbi:MAG: hypothetical protein AAGG68_01925 [Bacteroidota bacterium]
MKSIIYSLSIFSLMLFSCDGELPKISINTHNLELLSAENNLGFIVGFNFSNPSATQDSIEARIQEAITEGMSVGRLQIDWTDLEPEEGIYEEEELEEQLEFYSSREMEVLLTISVYDSEDKVVPSYLEDADTELLIQRFQELLDWVIPMLVEHNGYAIAVSNEPDNSFAEESDLAQEVIDFFVPVKDHIHQLEEKMAVTVTMNIENLKASKRDMEKLMQHLDVACFNIYGANFFDSAYTETEVNDLIDEVLDFSGERQLIVQELGMHNVDRFNSSEEVQRAFFEYFLTRMEQEERIRAAYVFQLVDWSPETVAFFNQVFEEEVPQEFIDNYGDLLQHIGLINYEDGTRKKAWDEFLKWVRRFEQ